MDTIRLGIVDDNPIYLKALMHVLDNHWRFHVIASSGSFQGFLEQLEGEDPDAILMDEGVFSALAEGTRRNYLRYTHDTPFILMAFERPTHIDRYRFIHPDMGFLAKEQGREGLVENLLEIIGNRKDARRLGIL